MTKTQTNLGSVKKISTTRVTVTRLKIAMLMISIPFFFSSVPRAFGIGSINPVYQFTDPANDFRVVRIYSDASVNGNDACTVLALDQTHLLTAAHCTAGTRFNKKIVLEYPEDQARENLEVFAVAKHELHRYKDKMTDDDVGADMAVLVLVKGLSRPVRKVTQADFFPAEHLRRSSNVLVVGAGMNEKRELGTSKILELQLMNLVKGKINENDREIAMPLALKVALRNPEELLCTADSGATVFVKTDGVVKILGVLSAQEGDRSLVCHRGNAFVALASMNLNWLLPLLK